MRFHPCLLALSVSALIIGCRSKSTESGTENKFNGADSLRARLVVDSAINSQSGIAIRNRRDSILSSSEGTNSHFIRLYKSFQIGSSSLKRVTAEIVTAEYPAKDCYFHESDILLVVRDEKMAVLHQATFHDSCDEQNVFTVATVPLPGKGNLFLCMSESVPSAPSSGVTGQYFCYNDSGHFVPIIGMIYPEANRASIGLFPLVRKTIDGIEGTYVEVNRWTGNFMIVVYYPLHLEGTSEPEAKPIKLQRYAVHVDIERAKQERGRADKDTVALYSAPSKAAGSMKLFRLGPNTNVEFLEAVEDSIFDKRVWRNPMWLRVRIDGNEGYISEDDFEAAGLPAAG